MIALYCPSKIQQKTKFVHVKICSRYSDILGKQTSAMNCKESLLTGLCRCCGGIKRCRLLNVEYEWQGQKEVYSDMFIDCFGLLLSHLDGDAPERVICFTCVSQLRKAAAFRRQVLSCEEKLLKTWIHAHQDDAVHINVKEEKREIKSEIDCTATRLSGEPVSLEAPLGNNVNDNWNREDSIPIEDIKKEKEMKIENTHNSVVSSKESPTLQTPDCANVDMDDNDDVSLASLQTKYKEKSRLKQHKMPLNMKRVSRLRTSKTETSRKGKSRRYQRYIDEQPVPVQPEIPIKPRRKYLETVEKAYSNAVTIVENSYVCPFTTSFSDYYCTYCRDTFTDPSKLREHTLVHDPTTFKMYYDNKKIAQLDITRIDCRLCTAQINDIDSLKDHLQKVHDKFLFPVTNEVLKFKLTINHLTCIECRKSGFKFFHALKRHMAEHFGACVCDVCGVHFFNKKTLTIHEKIHQNSPKELYPCKDCGKTFKSRNGRNLHEKKMHRKEAAFPCSKCEEVFFSYPLRYRHLIDVHGEDRKFPCDICDRVYDTRKSLREHNRKSHLKIMKHQCELCDKRFYQPSRLKEHMSTHTGERKYRCEQCGKCYPRLRGLNVHLQTHFAEKKYKCAFCNSSYRQNVNLKHHLKQHHQSIEMDDCSQSSVTV